MTISHFENCAFCKEQSATAANNRLLKNAGYTSPKDFLVETIKQYQHLDQHNVLSAVKLLSHDLVEIISNKELEGLHVKEEKIQQVS